MGESLLSVRLLWNWLRSIGKGCQWAIGIAETAQAEGTSASRRRTTTIKVPSPAAAAKGRGGACRKCCRLTYNKWQLPLDDRSLHYFGLPPRQARPVASSVWPRMSSTSRGVVGRRRKCHPLLLLVLCSHRSLCTLTQAPITGIFIRRRFSYCHYIVRLQKGDNPRATTCNSSLAASLAQCTRFLTPHLHHFLRPLNCLPS